MMEVMDTKENTYRRIAMKPQQGLPDCQHGTQGVYLKDTKGSNAYSTRVMASISAINGLAAKELHSPGTFQPPAYC